MSFTLPPDVEDFVREEVARGRYASADELLAEVIRLLRERERHRDELRKDLEKAVQQIEDGEYAEYDEQSLGEFFAKLKDEARRANQEAQQQATP